jgi:putative endonuclease
MEKGGYVYILANATNTVTYVGVTANLLQRIMQHKEKVDPDSFTAKYNITKLVYYTGFHHIEEAIAEEKRLKGGSRKKKYLLVSAMNPEWKDLTDIIVE